MILLVSTILLILVCILILVKLRTKEPYESKITMSLPEWKEFVGSGMNTLLLSGGIIPSGTRQTAGGNSGAVYRGHVRQGY